MCFQRPRRKESPEPNHFDIQLISTWSSLPGDFPIRLLEREMQLERSFDKSTVEELINMYSIAIEYYNIKQNDQAINYQIRMQKMLKRPEVLKIFTIAPSSKKKIEIPEPLEDDKPSDFTLLPLETPRTVMVKQTVQDKEISDKLTGGLLQDSLKSQENDLETRINRRKRTRTLSNVFLFTNEMEPPKTLESPKFTGSPKNAFLSPKNSIWSPKNAVTSPKPEITEEHEKELESAIQELMEKCYEEKSAKVSEITFKYNSEISSMEESGVMGAVISQLKQNMKEEIDVVNKEFDEKRRAEVKSLRESWGKVK